jgi:hypothetical protein
MLTDAVVILDRSLSMPMKDLYRPARRSASVVAGHISSGTPHSRRGVVGFAEPGLVDRPDRVGRGGFEITCGANLIPAVALGQELLAHRSGRHIAINDRW